MPLSHRLYVGTIGEGLYRSTDGGSSFVRTCDGMFVECHIRALAVHSKEPRTLYVGTEQGLYHSTDGADNWARVESPLNGMQIWSVLLLQSDPSVLVIGTCPSRLFRSTDGGRTWSEGEAQIEQDCPRIMHTRVTTLLEDPETPGIIWAGVEIDGVRRSRDGGRTWQSPQQKGISSRDIHALAIVPGKGGPQRLLATTNNDLNVSLDSGETWRPLQVGKALPWSYCRALAQMCGRPEVLLLGNGNGPPGDAGVVALSTDAGESWREARMPGRANSTIWNFATHPADPKLIYASSVSGEVYRSTDGGQSWEKLAREFGEIRALAWTP